MMRAILVASLLLMLSAYSQAETFDAVLEWDDVRVVSIPVDGLVTHVDAEQGQRVSKGDSLLRLSQTARRFALRKAEANLAATAAVLKEADRARNDAEVLYEQTVLSDIELQDARIRQQKAKAAHDTAQAELEHQKWALGWTQVRSPYAGVVIDSDVYPGQMVAGDVRSKPLMRLASGKSMRAVAVTAASRLSEVTTGDVMRVLVGDKNHEAKVVSLQRIAEKNAVDRVRLELQFASDQSYYPGIKATVDTAP